MPQQDQSANPPDPTPPAPILEYAGPDRSPNLKLRRLLAEHPAILAVVALIPLAMGGYLLWGLIMSPPPDPPRSFDVFYTIDDGKTVFVDHWPPTRKDALIAIVYTCDNNKTKFVHCLIKRTEEPFTPPGNTQTLTRRVNYIKKPGDTEWIPETNWREWSAIERSVKCPSDAGDPVMVTPYGMVPAVSGKGDSAGKGGAK